MKKNERNVFKMFGVATLFVALSSCGVISGGSCDDWSQWEVENTSCEKNFWCLRKKQKATYVNYVREKQCRNGVVQQRRKEKARCGC